MSRMLSIGQAREQLPRLPEELTHEHSSEAAIITRYGRPVLAVLPWELYEALVETLEIMGDPEQMALLRRSMQEVAEEKTTPWDDVKASLNLVDTVEDTTHANGD